MGLLNKILGGNKKKSTAKKKTTATKPSTKKTSASAKDKFYITDLSEDDKANTKASAKKNSVRVNLYKKVQQAIKNAELKKPENKLGRLEKIFTTDEAGKTIATIRYGSVIFYQGVMKEADVFDRHGKENFENKLGALKHLKAMLEADEWFDPQYEKYLKTKETADKKSAATKSANKKKTVASAKKAETKVSDKKKAAPKKKKATAKAKPVAKKTVAKKTTAKKPVAKKAAATKAKSPAKKTAAKKSSAKKSSAKNKTANKK